MSQTMSRAPLISSLTDPCFDVVVQIHALEVVVLASYFGHFIVEEGAMTQGRKQEPFEEGRFAGGVDEAVSVDSISGDVADVAGNAWVRMSANDIAFSCGSGVHEA